MFNDMKECDVMNRFVSLLLVLVCFVGFAGCGSRSMNDIIANEPSITGIVKDIGENAILIENTMANTGFRGMRKIRTA